jgi:hypothetical protein
MPTPFSSGFIWGIVAVCVTLLPANSAEIRTFSEGGERIIFISGAIEAGDYDSYLDALATARPDVVLLESPGGDLREGLAIAAETAMLGLTTYVGDGAGCFSACALIWVSGDTKVMHESASIGVHAAYYSVESEFGDVTQTVSSIGNANIGAFLNELGLDIDAINFFVAPPPDSIAMLTPARAEALNIPILLSASDGTTRRVAGSSPRQFVATAAMYTGMGVYCTPLFDGDPEFYQDQAALTLRDAHEIYGQEATADFLSQEVRRLQFELDEQGPLEWCLGAALRLVDARLSLGLEGPSFPCERASTAPELAVCNSPRLWVHDRALSTAYQALRITLDEGRSQSLLEDQRTWLRRRDACEADVECLEALYWSRLREMRDGP